MEHTAVRLRADAVARIDAMLPRFSTPWHEATRSEVVRELIRERLDALEHNPEILKEMWAQTGWQGPDEELLLTWMASRKPEIP